MTTMNTYRFRLYFEGLDYMSEETANALFEAGCDDCLPGSDGGHCYADFSRDGESLETAIRSAVNDAKKAGCNAERLEIDGEGLGGMKAG